MKHLILLPVVTTLMGGVFLFAQPAPARNFNMVTLGDSIIWGQGLPESMKFRTLVVSWLQSQYGSSRKVVQWTTHAHSGAVSGWGIYPAETNGNDPDTWYSLHPSSGYGRGYPYQGEVPFGYPSVSFQIGMTVNDLKSHGVDPANVDLVLFDGCINDLSVNNILNPGLVETNVLAGEVANGPNWVRTNTNRLCVTHMQSLLPQVLTQFPNAAVVMTGYFPIVSGQTDLFKLAEYMTVLGLAGGAGPSVVGVVDGPDAALEYLVGLPAATVAIAASLRDLLVDRSQAFSTTAFNGLSGLVNQANQGLAVPRVALAWPNFSDDNAYAAPNTYLFLLEDFLSDEIRGRKEQPPAGDWNAPQGVAYYRAQECLVAHPSDPTCYAAMVGHPNPQGAQAYAQAIISQLAGVLSFRLALPKVPQVSATSSILAQTPGQSLLLTAALTITDAITKSPVPGMHVWVQDGFGRTQSSGTTATDGTVRLPFTPCPQSYIGAHLLPSWVPSPACPIFGTSSAGYGMLNTWTPVLTATGNVTASNVLSVDVSDPLTKANAAGASVSVLDSKGQALTSGTTGLDGKASLNLGKACSALGYVKVCNVTVAVSKAGYLSCSFASLTQGAEASCQNSPYIGATPLPSVSGVVAAVPTSSTVSLKASTTAQLQIQLPTLSATACASADGKSCTANTVAPQNAPWDIVIVTSGGAPVGGANITVGVQSLTTTNAKGVAVISRLCYVSGSQVAQVNGKVVPVRTPVPCGQRTATTSAIGYQASSITLP